MAPYRAPEKQPRLHLNSRFPTLSRTSFSMAFSGILSSAFPGLTLAVTDYVNYRVPLGRPGTG